MTLRRSKSSSPGDRPQALLLTRSVVGPDKPPAIQGWHESPPSAHRSGSLATGATRQPLAPPGTRAADDYKEAHLDPAVPDAGAQEPNPGV
jgi:hypothetical protein